MRAFSRDFQAFDLLLDFLKLELEPLDLVFRVLLRQIEISALTVDLRR